MSTAVTSVPGPQLVCMPPRSTRPPLRLVQPGEHGPERVSEDVGLRVRRGVRLTRRGRLVITLAAALAVVTLAVALATSVDAAAQHIDHATSVSAGQTLSGVASTQLPSLPVKDAVAQIQLANDMNTSQVHAGQVLLIPELH